MRCDTLTKSNCDQQEEQKRATKRYVMVHHCSLCCSNLFSVACIIQRVTFKLVYEHRNVNSFWKLSFAGSDTQICPVHTVQHGTRIAHIGGKILVNFCLAPRLCRFEKVGRRCDCSDGLVPLPNVTYV